MLWRSQILDLQAHPVHLMVIMPLNHKLMSYLGTGFAADDGASLLMAFRGLQAESAAQGQAHKSIAKELNTLVADPFEDWAQGYRVKLGYLSKLAFAERSSNRNESRKIRLLSSTTGCVHMSKRKGM